MKKLVPVTLLLLCFYATFSQSVFKDYVDGQLYVKLKGAAFKGMLRDDPKNIPLSRFSAFGGAFTSYGVTKVSRPFYQAADDADLPYIVKIQFTKKQQVQAFISELGKADGIVYAEKVPLLKKDAVPNDPMFPSHLTQINAASAWNIFNGNSSNITVAIVDDAVMWTHVDLQANIYTNTGEIAGNNIDDDNNGYVDDIHGYDVSDLDGNTSPTNLGMDHGTHCAGIAGARTNNGVGIASIGWNIKIIPVKCEPDNGSVTNISNGYEGVIYAALAKARVISCSWGSPGASSTGQLIVDYAWNKGCLVVAAAGNSGVTSQNYPGAYNHVYCVASVESNDVKSSYSNYGTWIDISAPGSNVYSTVPYLGSPDYTYLSGTSMATPLVAGLAGLMLSKSPQMTATDVINCINSSAANIYNLSGNSLYASGNKLGAGRIDAYQAMLCASGFLNVPPVANFFTSPPVSCANAPVQFYDSSLYTPTSWAWTFQGGTPATSTASNPVVQWPANGNYNVSLTVTNANGSSIKTKQSYISITSPIQLPLVEGFQSTAFLPPNWTANNILNDGRFWERRVGFGGFGTSNACAMFDNYNYPTGGDRDEMRTPKYDLTGLSTVKLKFDVAYARFDAINSDSLEVKMTTDCGATWTTVYFKGGLGLATAPATGNWFIPNSAQWRRDSIDVSAMAAGQGNVMFSFINHGHYGQPIYLDNINLSIPSAVVAADIPFSVCSGVPVSFENQSVGATSYYWDFNDASVSNSSAETPTVTFTNAGDYTILLTGSNGSSSMTVSYNLVVIESPGVSFNMTPASCNTCTDGALQATPISGGAPFTYTWLPVGGNTPQAQNLAVGDYTLVINGNGCTSVAYAQVSISNRIGALSKANANLKIYPNPAKSNVTIELPGTFGYSLYSNLGQLVLQERSNSNSTLINLDRFSKGVYMLEIKTANETLRKKLIID